MFVVNCELTCEMPPILSLFLIWFATHHPEVFANQAEIKIALQKIPAPVVKERRQFFTDFLAQATSPFGLSTRILLSNSTLTASVFSDLTYPSPSKSE
jgi:hypothetical protein